MPEVCPLISGFLDGDEEIPAVCFTQCGYKWTGGASDVTRSYDEFSSQDAYDEDCLHTQSEHSHEDLVVSGGYTSAERIHHSVDQCTDCDAQLGSEDTTFICAYME